MVSFDKVQFVTFVFGVIVLTSTILSYNATVYNSQLQNLMDVLTSGLGFLFVAYAAILKSEGGKEMKSYKMVILAITLTSWFVWIFLGKLLSNTVGTATDSSPAGGWDNVAARVARPLALGSMFVLPYLFL